MEQIIAVFDQLGFWTWWIAAALLIILEAMAPGAVFLWLGISSAIVGSIAWIYPAMGWKLEASLFAVLSVVSVVVWRRFMKSHPQETDHPSLNERSKEMVGQELSLMDAIENGPGRVKIGDSVWLVEGPDLAKGTRVRVNSVNGSSLTVEAIPEST